MYAYRMISQVLDINIKLLTEQVNDAVLAGDNTLVSCSSDATLKVLIAIFLCLK